jgi:hypothetical protein
LFSLPTHLLTSLLYQLYTPPAPEIPDTNTLHYNNRNTPKHTQGPQSPAPVITLPPRPFPSPLYSATFTNYLNSYI